MMSPAELQAISERAEKATAGPWEYDGWELSVAFSNGIANRIYYGEAEQPFAELVTGDQGERDACFIAHARTDIPALLSMIQEATAIITAASEYVIDPDAPIDMSVNAVYTTPKTATEQLDDRIAAIKKTKELVNRIRTFLHP